MAKKITPIKKQLPIQRIRESIQTLVRRMIVSNKKFLERRPHRSFRRTRRRDYVRSLTLPGYWSFTAEVRTLLVKNKKIFVFVAIIYAVITSILVGITSQENYAILTDTLQETGNDVFSGNFSAVGQAGLLLLTATSGGLTTALSEVQQVYAGLIALMTWLTTVWLLRAILAGHIVKVRDGLYNASAPLLSTAIVALVMVIQLLPLAFALIGYGAAVSTGLLDGGVEAMLFWLAAGLLGLLSLYWITSTAVALVVVTLPGMYPFKAIKTAGDLVVGRRIRILLRLVWLAFIVVITWAIVMIPIILFDTWLKSVVTTIDWLPIIPIALLIMSSVTIVWSASYIYLLYRKIVADDADPA